MAGMLVGALLTHAPFPSNIFLRSSLYISALFSLHFCALLFTFLRSSLYISALFSLHFCALLFCSLETCRTRRRNWIRKGMRSDISKLPHSRRARLRIGGLTRRGESRASQHRQQSQCELGPGQARVCHMESSLNFIPKRIRKRSSNTCASAGEALPAVSFPP
jgi:hypothetical protein